MRKHISVQPIMLEGRSIMKKRRAGFALAAAALLCLSGPVAAMAATVGLGPASTGVSYQWGVTMNGNDTTTGSSPAYAGTVGAYSWNDPSNAGNPTGTGWTHTSNWTALTLTDAADLSVTLERTTAGAGGLVPAFSLWQGQHLSGGVEHNFNNAGAIAWAPGLTYLGNEANLSGLSSITKNFSLGPGLYTLNFGGNPSSGQAVLQGYQATLTTAPAAVPLPAAVWLFGSGIAGVVGLARRRRAAA